MVNDSGEVFGIHTETARYTPNSKPEYSRDTPQWNDDRPVCTSLQYSL